MAVVAPGQDTPQQTTPATPATPATPRPAPHGKKRAADGSLESEQRLSKRFDLLDLNRHGARRHVRALAPVSDRTRAPPPDDCMLVEDTPDRVYIYDLDAELSDIESDEEKPVFLSDIEKHLAKIPKHVLLGPEPRPTEHNQLVLYNIPSSLTVPPAQDSVRKAIVEARARAREKQANPSGEPGPVTAAVSMPMPVPAAPMADVDAMDIDG